MVCPRCRVALFGIGTGPRLKLAARCKDCGAASRLPEGIVESGTYRCVKCGGALVPDDSAEGAVATGPMSPPSWSTQATAPMPAMSAAVRTDPNIPQAEASWFGAPTSGSQTPWFGGGGSTEGAPAAHAESAASGPVPPGLRRRTTLPAGMPAVNAKPSNAPLPAADVGTREGGAGSSTEAPTVPLKKVAAPVPEPLPDEPPVRIEIPAITEPPPPSNGASARVETVTERVIPRVEYPKQLEVVAQEKPQPAPAAAASDDETTLKPPASEDTAPPISSAAKTPLPALWVAVAILVILGGLGAVALGMGWIHLWPSPKPPPPEAPSTSLGANAAAPAPPTPAPTAPAPAPPAPAVAVAPPAPSPAPTVPAAAKNPTPAPAATATKNPPAAVAPGPPAGQEEVVVERVGKEKKGGKAEAARLQRAGYKMLERGDVDGALATFKKAIALNPVAAMAFRGLGAAYSAKGNSKEAAKAYKKYLALNPHAQDAAEVRALVQQLQ